jgi:hypothetical protein
MINPSASGWIDKYFLKQKNKEQITYDTNLFYTTIRKQDLYMVISLLKQPYHNNKGWVQNEIPKVALLNTLYAIYGLATTATKILIHSLLKR